MAILEQMARLIEESEGYIQDDGKITNFNDVWEMSYRMTRIRSLALEVEKLLQNG